MTTIDELLKELSINHPLEQALRPVIDAAMTARAAQMAKKQQQFGAYGWIKGNGNIVAASINAHADNVLSIVICEWAKINPGPLEAALDKKLHHLIPRNPFRRAEAKAKYQQYFETSPISPISSIASPIETTIEDIEEPIEEVTEVAVKEPIVAKVTKKRFRGKGNRSRVPKNRTDKLLARIASLEMQLEESRSVGNLHQADNLLQVIDNLKADGSPLSWAEMCDD
jgi:hypothetical protein